MRLVPRSDPVPELADLPVEERRRIVKQCRRRALWRWPTRAVVGFCVVIVGMGWLAGVTVMPVSDVVAVGMIYGVLACVAGLVVSYVIDVQSRRLAVRAHPRVCQGCGYDLRGNIRARTRVCPECGEAIRQEQLQYGAWFS